MGGELVLQVMSAILVKEVCANPQGADCLSLTCVKRRTVWRRSFRPVQLAPGGFRRPGPMPVVRAHLVVGWNVWRWSLRCWREAALQTPCVFVSVV